MKESEDNTEQSDVESLTPERDAIWAKHYKLTPALCEEMLEFAGEMEQERNVWKHSAKVAAAEVEATIDRAIVWFIEFQELGLAIYDALRATSECDCGEKCGVRRLRVGLEKALEALSFITPQQTDSTKPNQEDK